MSVEKIVIFLGLISLSVWLIVSEIHFLQNDESNEEDDFTKSELRIRSWNILISGIVLLAICLFLIYENFNQ